MTRSRRSASIARAPGRAGFAPRCTPVSPRRACRRRARRCSGPSASTAASPARASRSTICATRRSARPRNGPRRRATISRRPPRWPRAAERPPLARRLPAVNQPLARRQPAACPTLDRRQPAARRHPLASAQRQKRRAGSTGARAEPDKREREMRVESQDEVKAFLADPARAGGPVTVAETHVSAVYLANDRAWKLKQAVRLPYADFSTPAIRLAACEKEFALNAATTPELYLGVRRITRENGGLAFDGAGALVDAVVEMRRFDENSRFDHMARRGALTAPLVAALAERIAAAQETARIAPGGDGAERVAGVLAINRAGFAESGVFPPGEVAALDAAFAKALAAHSPLLDARARAGAVRRCHGDLHLRNVCLFEGRPTLFDCLDFNDDLATVDVLYDLAFMAMDLWHESLPGFANLLVNRHLDVTGQDDGVPLLPFFTALRAAVRAHVTATQSRTAAPGDVAGLRAAAQAYRDLAAEVLVPRAPRVVAIGGLSGSGKSTVAEAFAPRLGAPPGARIVESDRVRKAMFGVAPGTRLPDEAY